MNRDGRVGSRRARVCLASAAAATTAILVGVAGSSAALQTSAEVNGTERVSVDSSGAEANGASNNIDRPVVSADGRFVAFNSNATNLVPGDTNNHGDAFVHDRQTGLTERVSVDSSGTQGNGGSWPCGI